MSLGAGKGWRAHDNTLSYERDGQEVRQPPPARDSRVEVIPGEDSKQESTIDATGP